MQQAFCSQVGRLILIMFQENLMSLRVTNNCVSYQNDTFKIESETKKWDDFGLRPSVQEIEFQFGSPRNSILFRQKRLSCRVHFHTFGM